MSFPTNLLHHGDAGDFADAVQDGGCIGAFTFKIDASGGTQITTAQQRCKFVL